MVTTNRFIEHILHRWLLLLRRCLPWSTSITANGLGLLHLLDETKSVGRLHPQAIHIPDSLSVLAMDMNHEMLPGPCRQHRF